MLHEPPRLKQFPLTICIRRQLGLQLRNDAPAARRVHVNAQNAELIVKFLAIRASYFGSKAQDVGCVTKHSYLRVAAHHRIELQIHRFQFVNDSLLVYGFSVARYPMKIFRISSLEKSWIMQLDC